MNEKSDLVENECNSKFNSMHTFTISSEEAAKILGVNRSRLSQITSKGQLSYEKRKIETRNRLFYKLSDLLNYQRNNNIQLYEKEFTVIAESKSNIQDIKETINKEKNISFFKKEISKHNNNASFSMNNHLAKKSKSTEKHLNSIENIEKKIKDLENRQDIFFKEFLNQNRKDKNHQNKLFQFCNLIINKINDIKKNSSQLTIENKENKPKKWKINKVKYRV